jgi:hypothetical protein
MKGKTSKTEKIKSIEQPVRDSKDYPTQVKNQMIILEKITEKLVRISLELEDILSPILTVKPIKEETSSVTSINVPLAMVLQDMNVKLNLTFENIKSIAIRCEL